jgi:hypothetical protein
MASLIPKTNNSIGSASPPTAGALVTGELAENKYTGRLYLKKEDGTVVDAAKVQLTGDLTGTTSAPSTNLDGGTIGALVKGLNGIPLSTSTPQSLQSLVYSTSGIWNYGSPAAGSVAGYPLSDIAPTTGQVLQFQTNTDGIQRWTPSTVPLIKGTVNFDGAFASTTIKTGTYSKSGSTVTVTITAHGLKTDHVLYFEATTGTAVDELAFAVLVNANTFTFTASSSGTTSGNCQFRICPITSAVNIDSITYCGKASNYAVYGINLTNAGFTNFNFTGTGNVFVCYPYFDRITLSNIPPTAISVVFSTLNGGLSYADTGQYSGVMCY